MCGEQGDRVVELLLCEVRVAKRHLDRRVSPSGLGQGAQDRGIRGRTGTNRLCRDRTGQPWRASQCELPQSLILLPTDEKRTW